MEIIEIWRFKKNTFLTECFLRSFINQNLFIWRLGNFTKNKNLFTLKIEILGCGAPYFNGILEWTKSQDPLAYLSNIFLFNIGDHGGVVNIGKDGYNLMVFAWVDQDWCYFISKYFSFCQSKP